jgi:DNA-binding SARP family transcriptional activator
VLEFRVLGPLEVRRDGRLVDVRGSKRRAVLALLLLQANEIVRTERLIEDLWGERRPVNAPAALHNHVSRLRKDLGEGVLVTKPWGYVLRASPETIDLGLFESQVTEARPLPARERNEKLGAALTLWQGAALADLVNEPALAGEIGRLEELRETVIEQRIDAQLELGEHDEAIRVLEGLIAAHPLRERLRGQLILALYRAGRQAEALETYRETRRVLVEELGIEPSPELRELERAILRQDPSLASAPGPPAQPPTGPLPPESRWRWPRSPLLIGAALLVVMAGAGVAILAAPRSGTPHASAARPAPSALTKTATSTSSTLPTTAASTHRTDSPDENRPSRPRPHPTRPRPHTPVKVAVTSSSQVTTAESSPQQARSNKPNPPPHPPPPPRPPPPPPPPQPTLITDEFEDSVLNTTIWHQIATGTGIDIAERNGRLEIDFAADGVPGGEYNILGAHYGTQCRFPEDFDVRVDYQLLDWPPANGVFVQLNAWFTNRPQLAIVRQSQTSGEEYATFWGGHVSNRRTADTSGSLRIKRVGSRFTTYHKSGRTWLPLDSVLSEGAPMISIQAMSMPDWFGHKAVRVALDNFSMRAVRPAC